MARNIRLGYSPDEPEATLAEARINFVAVFPSRGQSNTVYGETCRCGRFRARKDTRRCEWCSGPRRFPQKRTRRTGKAKAVR
jgi:hypothetical protein